MHCIICYNETTNKLCNSCNNIFTYDSKNKLYRKKKRVSLLYTSIKKEHFSELILYKSICKIFGGKNVYRNIYPTWALSIKQVLFEYDIAVLKNKLLIEYDGKQHFIFPNFFHRTKSEFLEQKLHDKIKNKLAQENDWKLIRFSYKELIDEINVEKKLKENKIIC